LNSNSNAKYMIAVTLAIIYYTLRLIRVYSKKPFDVTTML